MLTSALLLLASAPLTLQTSDRTLVPPELLPLGGYTARHGAVMTGIGDPLHARVLLLRQGSETLALVSCEMLTIPESLSREVQKRLPAHTDLFLTATHTHCAPDSQMLNDRMTLQIPGISSFRPRWLTWYANALAEGVQKAQASPQTTLSSLTIRLSHADANRGRRKFADPDQSFSLLESAGKPLFAHYAAHATLYSEKENVTHGDWPGTLAQRLAAPVLMGAIGDVSPKASGEDPADRVKRMAASLLEAGPQQTLGVYQPGDRFQVVREPIALGVVSPHPDFGRSYGIPDSLAAIVVKTFAPTTASITAFRLGSMAVVGVPGEPSSHLGRSIRDYGRVLGFRSVLVVSHVNAWMGYILGPEDYDRGGYEATLNFYGREEGLRVVDAAERALLRLRG